MCSGAATTTTTTLSLLSETGCCVVQFSCTKARQATPGNYVMWYGNSLSAGPPDLCLSSLFITICLSPSPIGRHEHYWPKPQNYLPACLPTTSTNTRTHTLRTYTHAHIQNSKLAGCFTFPSSFLFLHFLLPITAVKRLTTHCGERRKRTQRLALDMKCKMTVQNLAEA